MQAKQWFLHHLICRRIQPLVFSFLALGTICAHAQTIILTADQNSGHDQAWVKRYSAGVKSWGIIGNHIPGTNGYIWFDSFPGESGRYKIELGAVLEPDGDSNYRLYIADQKVVEGRYPFANGEKNCDASELESRHLDCGTHQINKGDQVRLWGESVYPCGTTHGQYTRWFELKFTKIKDSVKPSPLDKPQIENFYPHSYTITKGEEVSLNWRVINADHVLLQGEKVASKGTKIFHL